MYILRFLMTNLLISVLLLAFLGIRGLLSRYWTAGCRYAVWIIPAAALLIALLPFRLFPSSNESGARIEYQAGTAAVSAALTQTPATDGSWIQDFTEALERPDLEGLNQMITVLWCFGMAAALGFYLLAHMQLKKICRHTHAPDPCVRALYCDIKSKLGIRRNITLLVSGQVSTPLIYGISRPCLILPAALVDKGGKKNNGEIGFILLHELTHYKNHDLIYNQILLLLKLPYWFNPMIHVISREFRSDRELYCDACLLHGMLPGDRLKYGHTILNFAAGAGRILYGPVTTGFSGTKKQLTRRIKQIAAYRVPSGHDRLRDTVSFLLVALLLVIQLPLLNAQAAGSPVSASAPVPALAGGSTVSSVPVSGSSALDVHGYFQGLDGCMVLTDLNSGQYRIYNEEKSTRRIPPDSTYKIYSALNALEAGIITPEQNTLPWNGQSYPFPDWESDHSLQSAMQYSVNWYFQDLDQEAGLENLKNFYHRIGYGNQDLSGGIDRYWLETSLAISPLEQTELLKSFYLNEFGFQPENVAAVKKALMLSSGSLGTLSGKTGTAMINGVYVSSWFVGYVETPDNTWFFATNISNADNTAGNTSAMITLQVLEDMGLYTPD